MHAITRRQALAAGGAVLAGMGTSTDASAQTPARAVTKGRLKQSVSRWCYGKIPMPEFCDAVRAMG